MADSARNARFQLQEVEIETRRRRREVDGVLDRLHHDELVGAHKVTASELEWLADRLEERRVVVGRRLS